MDYMVQSCLYWKLRKQMFRYNLTGDLALPLYICFQTYWSITHCHIETAQLAMEN